MFRPILVALSLVLATLASTPPAYADWPSQFVEITCAKELQYFSIRKIQMEDVPTNGPYLDLSQKPRPQVRKTVEGEYHLYDDESLTLHPKSCEIPALKEIGGSLSASPAIHIEVIGRHRYKYDSKTGRDVVDAHEIDTQMDDKTVAKLDLSVVSPRVSDTSLVEIHGFGQFLTVRVCNLPESDQAFSSGETDQTECAVIEPRKKAAEDSAP